MSKPSDYKYYKPDFDLERSKIQSFLQTFIDKNLDKDRIYDQRKYMIELVNNYFNLSKKLQISNLKYLRFISRI